MASAEVVRGGGAVRLSRPSGVTELTALWLRVNDPGRMTANHQRLHEISDTVASCPTVVSCSVEPSSLRVVWSDGSAPTTFPFDRLATPAAAADQAVLWNSRLRALLPEVPHAALSTPEGLLKISTHLDRYGLVVLKNAPLDEGTVIRVGDAIGSVRTTNYGTLFDVVDKGSQGNNLAQTNLEIKAHTDNPYRDPVPGVQLLHCIKGATTGGGETTFTDGFACAEILRRSNPEAFRVLCEVAQPYRYVDSGVDLQACVPVFTLSPDGSGRVVRVAFNNRSAAPVRGLTPEAEHRYFKAWAAFDEVINSDAMRMKVLLQPGDVAVFMNTRVMHGRTAYAPGAARHLQGCYVDHDAIRSRVAASPSAAVDVHDHNAAVAIEALRSQAQFSYGEDIHMLSHAIQACMEAERMGASEEEILSALMHDVGNSPQARKAWVRAGGKDARELPGSDGSVGFENHAVIGAQFCRGLGFSELVCSAVELHVEAKRALVAMDKSYMNELSQASIDTLKHQGGPLSPSELAAFMKLPGARTALMLRRCDDCGKVKDRDIPSLESFRERIARHLRDQTNPLKAKL
eukprot:TRINITY_DN320_c0_g1_i1.p1 TRINITY_DN320_c0_g1~~TRINITY_DN320_c0_g1_i1.p1  ORF type:complete len:573 (+),score=174.79 TRINITY_DN320_c0_g1_i1:60-1778(+)